MCNSARDMRLLVEAVLNAKPWSLDPSLIPLPLQVPDISQKKLRVGIMMHDGVVLPHPPMLRGLKFAKAKLEASSEVEVVDYAPFQHEEGYSIIVSICLCHCSRKCVSYIGHSVNYTSRMAEKQSADV